ncbi:MAG: antibiotic biosynthesis monooxygenase [Candidatus Krumholzibacteriota bacterium]|nr:antibiotic biosynthesis monooxygenase [Candidatus Krumholzibacteriota bacterium]
MITVGMNYEVREGKAPAFEKKFALVMDVMDPMEGHVDTHLFRDVFQERGYLVVSEWETRESFDTFVGSDEFRKVTDWGTANILATRPTHEVYETAAQPLAAARPSASD